MRSWNYYGWRIRDVGLLWNHPEMAMLIVMLMLMNAMVTEVIYCELVGTGYWMDE